MEDRGKRKVMRCKNHPLPRFWIPNFVSHQMVVELRGWSHWPNLTKSIRISSCNSVERGGPTSISQQFHGWNRMESLVWSGHQTQTWECGLGASPVVVHGIHHGVLVENYPSQIYLSQFIPIGLHQTKSYFEHDLRVNSAILMKICFHLFLW